MLGITGWLVLAAMATDGDSIRQTGVNYRLACVDAPEWSQPWSRASQEALQELMPAITHLETTDVDRYGRPVVLAWMGRDLAQRHLVRAGLAYVDLRYQGSCPTQTLLNAQKAAQRERLGVWRDPDAIPPWEWRRGRR